MGSSDPTKHVYMSIVSTYQPITMDILTNIGLYVDGKFKHPFFDPKRHMPPCNFNAKCNMSPVIPDFFIGLKSMMNAQALDHTNGLAKYVCKYIGKFDDCNYTMLCQDVHTREFVLGKTHLHNTKVVRSKINEDKAFSKNKMKNHPKGREMPHFEIRQILLGHEEVFTNLNFKEISTLMFELRSTIIIELDTRGIVNGMNNSNQ